MHTGRCFGSVIIFDYIVSTKHWKGATVQLCEVVLTCPSNRQQFARVLAKGHNAFTKNRDNRKNVFHTVKTHFAVILNISVL